MRYTLLGNSDLSVSEISFGSMSLGRDHAANARLLHRAIELGINFFDTADLYDKGENEISLGKAFKGRRDQVILATKGGNQWRADGSGWDWNPRKAYLHTAVKDSLRRLQTDYIDLYQLHGGTIEDPIDEAIEAFEELKSEGLIRHYGISSIRPNVIREWATRSHMASVMMQYSLLDRRPEEACFPLLAEKGISVIVRGGLAKGLLVGKEAKPYLGHEGKAVKAAQQLLGSVAGDSSLGQSALRFALAPEAVATVAVGASSLAQLEDNARTSLVGSLSEAELHTLRAGVVAGMYEAHR